MADPRCSCDSPECPICSAPEHTPWMPKAGTREQFVNMLGEDTVAEFDRRMAAEQAAESATLHRYLLVLLMSLLGGMIGGMTSAIAILHYLD